LPLKIRKTLYYSLFDSHLNFENLTLGCANRKLINKVKTLEQRCIKSVGLTFFRAHTELIFKDMEILKFSDKLAYCKSIFMHQYKLRPASRNMLRRWAQ
jgi:hypothetical protein